MQLKTQLEAILEKAASKKEYKSEFEEFKAYQLEPNSEVDFSDEFINGLSDEDKNLLTSLKRIDKYSL